MEKYKFLKHTADAKMQAFGKDLNGAFSNAAIGMFSLMFEPDKIKAKIEKKISVQGNDKKALLYNFLEELIFLLDSENFVLASIKSLDIKDNWLDAILVGDTMSDKYESHGEVKAVTYNEMEITEDKGKAVVQVVLDL